MTGPIEKKISNLVEQQFPSFYRQEGSLFIDFVRAYFEWAETEGVFMYQGRRIFENRDIDETLEAFLYYFQTKYLYGIPFDVIINKRYLLKHVLDVYRSKGTIQCYKLLFRLIYDQDIEIYLPGRDMLRFSDGTWKEPRYLEITNVDSASDLVGKTIHGLSSQTTAVVESYVTEVINGNIIATLYISNIRPRGALFENGEKIVDVRDLTSANLASIVAISPTIIGSLDYVEVLSGGTGFTLGDVVKIARKDPSNGAIISFGTEGTLRVSETRVGLGQVNFSILSNGTGTLEDPDLFLYRALSDTTGNGASFEVGSLYAVSSQTYNEDLICNYVDVNINATSYGFPAAPTANSANTLASCLRFFSNNFGSVLTLANTFPGINYTANPDIFVRSVHLSNAMPGTITFATNSSNVTGTSTQFTRFFANGDVIHLQANATNSATAFKAIIREVVNNTIITLYARPTINSTASAQYRVAPNIYSSQWAFYEPQMNTEDASIAGLNVNISAEISQGNNVVSGLTAVNSGKAYIDGEQVRMFLFGSLTEPVVSTIGSGYTNGDILIFSGGNPIKIATGYVQTHANSSVANVVMTYSGSGYQALPTITVRSNTGTGATFTTTLVELNTNFETTGIVRKGGVGRGPGYWTTTRGFFNSDKYIQDSYFYQDFSYQIRAASTLSRYRDILYETFHTAGTEMFGEFLLQEQESANAVILSEQTSATIS